MSLRQRLENSIILERALGAAAAAIFFRAARTTRWRAEGTEALEDLLAQGPVLLLSWHSRLLMAIPHWPADRAPLTTIHNRSPIGRLGAEVARRRGLSPVTMARRGSNREISRRVLKAVRAGSSLGMAADGPVGPAHEVSRAVLDWARITGAPIVGYAFSTTRGRRAGGWDNMLLPRAKGDGALVFAPFDHPPLPRDATRADRAAYRQALKGHLDATTARADAMLGLPPGA